MIMNRIVVSPPRVGFGAGPPTVSTGSALALSERRTSGREIDTNAVPHPAPDSTTDFMSARPFSNCSPIILSMFMKGGHGRAPRDPERGGLQGDDSEKHDDDRHETDEDPLEHRTSLRLSAMQAANAPCFSPR
jgi:hypothetical protein